MPMQSGLGLDHSLMGEFLFCLYYLSRLVPGEARNWTLMPRLGVLVGCDLGPSPNSSVFPGLAPSSSARPGQ